MLLFTRTGGRMLLANIGIIYYLLICQIQAVSLLWRNIFFMMNCLKSVQRSRFVNKTLPMLKLIMLLFKQICVIMFSLQILLFLLLTHPLNSRGKFALKQIRFSIINCLKMPNKIEIIPF